MRSYITNDDTHVFFTRYHQDLISNSPYRLPYSSWHISLENLVLDQLKIFQMIFLLLLFIITCPLDILLIL